MRKYERIFSAMAIAILLTISACTDYTDITQHYTIKRQFEPSQLFTRLETRQTHFTQYHNMQPENTQPSYDDLIRLHVIANSDSPEDQALKLKVRDRLLLAFGESFKETQSMEEAREIIEANLPKLEKVAFAEIQNQGYNYGVKAQLGTWPFPTRVYGDEVYPAGEYEALRLVIGEGKGANWWCVMFPPMCFVDVSSSMAEELEEDVQYQAEQKGSFAERSGTLIEEEETIVYTFKAVELWKSFREWLGNIFT